MCSNVESKSWLFVQSDSFFLMLVLLVPVTIACGGRDEEESIEHPQRRQ